MEEAFNKSPGVSSLFELRPQYSFLCKAQIREEFEPYPSPVCPRYREGTIMLSIDFENRESVSVGRWLFGMLSLAKAPRKSSHARRNVRQIGVSDQLCLERMVYRV